LRAGDVLLTVDGADVDGITALRRALGQAEGTIRLYIMRDRARQELQVTLESRE
jgi:S1-C subfamily serine protease